ncbi:MAG: serine--tRNA ligase [Candidatus Aenigmarchaeota archaeon]|nr:serine--tRNA ligase [Candidatus Aenigmarchaeota archaeon]
MFNLKGFLQLSKEAKIPELKGWVKEANETILKKGADLKVSKPSKITVAEIKKDRLYLTIEGEYPRPHDALQRFRKFFAEKAGKEHKIGVRGQIAEEYSAVFELEQKALKTVSVPFAEVKIDGKKCSLKFKDLTEDFLQKNYIDRIMNLVKEKIKYQFYEGKDEFSQTTWTGKERPTKYRSDPSEDLENKLWIKRTASKGQWVIGREFTVFLNSLKTLMKENVFKKLGFQEMIFPKFEYWDYPKGSGHANTIYPNAYFVMVPKNSSTEFWEPVSDHYKITKEIDKKGILERVESVGIMSYAQCPPFWALLQQSTVDESSLPLKVFDWSGPTYRNEAGGTHGLDRLEEFRRIEMIWVAKKEDEIKIWKDIVESLKNFYDKVLDLEIRTDRVTPWWMAHAGIRTDKGTDEMGTIDFNAYLPYRGDRKQEWLEIQNASSNGIKYTDGFGVKLPKGELWSGCAGAGLDRIAVALLAQKGVNPKDWPSALTDLVLPDLQNINPLKLL